VQACRARPCAAMHVPSHERLSPHSKQHKSEQKLTEATLPPDERNWEQQAPSVEARGPVLYAVAPSGWGQKLCSSTRCQQTANGAQVAQVAATQAGECRPCNFMLIRRLQLVESSTGMQVCACVSFAPAAQRSCCCTGSCCGRCSALALHRTSYRPWPVLEIVCARDILCMR
jgi:hypothetical protein